MKKRTHAEIVSAVVFALGLAGASGASAATTTTVVAGSMGPTQETCLQGLTNAVGDGENCMYDEGPPAAPILTPIGTEVTGSYNHISYYDSVDTPASFLTTTSGSARVVYLPTVGDGKMSQDVNGTITIDDAGDGFGPNDLISFNLTLRSSGPGSIVRVYSGSAGVDKYDTMNQVLAPRAVDSATANGSGGFDYIIGSEGFPDLRTFSQAGACLGRLFGFVECGHSFATPSVEPNFWDGTSAAGIGSLENNLGAKTTGTVTNLHCIDGKSASGVESNDCHDSQVLYSPWVLGPCAVQGGCTLSESTGGVRGSAEDVAWDQLLLKVSTDAAGDVVSVEGFNVDDYRVFNQTRCGDNLDGVGSYLDVCNSWTSGYFTLSPAASGAAVDDGPAFALVGSPVEVAIAANDTDFRDPVTISIATDPTQGTAVPCVVIGPICDSTVTTGAAADVRILYTPNPGASGNDSFEYTVTDGSSTDTAMVSIVIGVGANADFAYAGRNQAIDISVGANDVGFDSSVTVTINADFDHGGSATVAGTGGPASAIVVQYTPVSAQGDPDYAETFTYTIDDGVAPPSTATVTVSVSNRQPQNLDGNLELSTQGQAPVDPDPEIGGLTGKFTVANGSLGNQPSTLVVTVDGAHGHAEVDATSSNAITYTITDPTFLTGTDTFTYSVTDRDGESDTGEVIVTVAPLDPVLAHNYIVTAKNKASLPLKLRIDGLTPDGRIDGGLLEIKLGNGSLAQHTLEITTQGSHGTCALRDEDGVNEIWFTLVYTPTDPDYVTGDGPHDSCTLLLTDADGDSTTDAVDIKVVEPSPVGGAGAMDPWSLMLLAVAPLLRRVRRKPKDGVRSKRSGLAAIAIALAAASGSAIGQEDDSDGIQEIVVTARKVEENIMKVPLAITAFDSDMIEQKNITNLVDVAALTPGLSFFNAFGENLPVPVIRGMAPTDIFGQNNAAIFVDGVYIAGREGLNAVQLDLERIEVLKGPQSSQYGRTAFAGAINYVTKKPVDEFESKVTAKTGNDGKLEGSAVLNLPIFGEMLMSRFGVLYDDYDGSYNNPLAPENDIGGHTYRSFKAALRSKPTEDWNIDLTYQHSNDDIDESPAVALPTNCEERVNDNNAAVRLQNFCGEVPDIEEIPGMNGMDDIPKVAQATGEGRELDRASLTIDWDLHEWGSITSLTGYSNTQQNSVSDFNRSLGVNERWLYCPDAPSTPGIPNTCTFNPEAGHSLPSFFRGIYDKELGGETEEWSEELRFTSSQDQRFRFNAGATWYQTKSKSFPGGTIATNRLPNDGNVALPPFSDPPDSPNLAIGYAIFYDTFSVDPITGLMDGGFDPLGRQLSDNTTEGWGIFTGTDFDITEKLIGRAEIRLSQESQELNSLRYNRCYTSATTNGRLGNCVYPDEQLSLYGDDKFDLRPGFTGPVPLFGSTCVATNPETGGCIQFTEDSCAFTSVEGVTIDGTPGQCSRTGRARFESVTGRLGLDYQITDDWMVYGSIAYGEKPGGLQLLSGSVPTGGGSVPVAFTNTFDPETLTAYEIGAKGRTLDNRLSLAGAIFYNDWQDIVLRQLVETNPETGETLEQPAALNVNAADAGIWGLELEANMSFTDNFQGRATVGWVDAPIDNAQQDTFELFPTFAAAGYGVDGGDVSGANLLRQPEWLLSASLDYSHEMSEDWEWYLGADANYQSEVYVGNDNQGWLPEHTYVNTRLGFKSGVYSIEFWTRNLFDDNNAIAAFRDIYWANTADQYPINGGTPGPGNVYPTSDPRPGFDDFVPLRYTVTYPNERSYGLTFSMRFGAAVK